MAKNDALDTLITLAQRQADDAAKLLGKALKSVADAEQKLTMLLGYRDDYALRLDAAQVAGITPMAYHNFVAFMAKLDVAVSGQQELLRQARLRSEQQKAAWQACERKRLSYRTLHERAAHEAVRIENKRDQKLMDEHATRQAHYKQ